ncbi:MAG: adenylate/guanylate cyclase domain-containing protein, partial [Gammaproteobacteria bacterium]|nr:adenylate/guanylate cyclase domain-containing protein [Gammaproteobacteria bacterium]
LKGKKEEIEVFQPLAPDEVESPATQAYREAFAKLAAEEPEAKQSFAALVGQYGDDPLANFHLKRLLAGDTGCRIVFEQK